MVFRIDQPLPPPFDPAFYRANYPELGLSGDADAVRHYTEEGRAGGRLGSPLARREGLVDAIDPAAPTLEIGPFCAPLLSGPAVRYLDRLDAGELRARAIALGLDPAGCPERIDYVGSLGAAADETFDAVLASHAIEHQPDLVRHLQEVARVLRPNGRYWLIVPDKRFCFDHFIAESTIADILDAFGEERTVHGLGSVVEHVALAAHNDPFRHWRGDHGDVPPEERDRRVGEALRAHRRSDGGYIDVHAWQFTPRGFADAMTTLARLDLSAFEVEAVYDTPRDRAEFCAVLRRVRPARSAPRRRHGHEIVVMQTADAFRYARMLALTAPNVAEYCRRWGFRYESFVGLKRGVWPWQAAFNRILMLEEQIARGFAGWAVYLDADAYIQDLDFDLPAYLRGLGDVAAVFAESGVTGQRWDVNDGVAFINLGHPMGRRLVERWAERFRALSDDALATWRDWNHDVDDQSMLHAILREDHEIGAAVHVESMALVNSPHARFVRQRLRAQFGSFEDRLTAIAEEVAAVMRGAGVAEPVDLRRGREAAKLLHVLPEDAWLAEAPAGAPDRAAAERAIAAWHAHVGGSAGPASSLADALDRGDRDAVATEIAAFGRSPAARGVLGGDRQHRKAREDTAFARQRALRTHDALLSLAEATGAIRIENPDLGAWGGNPAIAPAALFEAIERAVGHDLAPPPRIGAYLGLQVGRAGGRAIVLHLRMIEAIYAAWRLGQVAGLLGSARVIEIGGGFGLAGWYARRFGAVGYARIGDGLSAAIEAYLDDAPSTSGSSSPLLFAEDLAGACSEAAALRHIDDAMAGGVRAFLSFAHEASPEPATDMPTVAAIMAKAGGWRRAWRSRHGTKPGYVEELFLRD